jgi:hypothetical protein
MGYVMLPEVTTNAKNKKTKQVLSFNKAPVGELCSLATFHAFWFEKSGKARVESGPTVISLQQQNSL